MRQGRSNLIYNRLFIAALFTLLFLNTFQRTQYAGVLDISEYSINLTFFVMLLGLVMGWLYQNKYDVSLKGIYISLALMLVIFIFSFYTSDYIDGIGLLKLSFLFLFILGSIRMKWTAKQVKAVGYILAIIIIMFFVHWIESNFMLHGFKSIFRNQNYFGVLLFSMLYFNIISVKYSQKLERFLFAVVTVMNITLIFATNTRSVLIGIAVALLAWIILKQFRNKFRYLLYIVMIGNLLFAALYIGLKNTFLGDLLNKGSILLFNKNLFSGRSEIWDQVIHAIIQKPLLGYGVGVNASDVTAANLTAHNMYLQILLELGLIGLVFFILLLVSIWRVLIKRLDCFVARWSACFMLGILVYESFELTLFQNNYSIAFFQWLVITFGVSFVGDQTKTDQNSSDRFRR